jgi:Xaa-Pro aminopeptidase
LKQIEVESISQSALPDMTNSARQKTWKAVADIAQMIQPGMTEKEAIQKANAYFAEKGVRKFWHKTHVRFGQSTIFGFDDPYESHVVLKDNDIFYVDIGPIWNGVEGDCGDTFVVGNQSDFLKIKNAVKTIFDQTCAYWKQKHVSGKEMYAFAYDQIIRMGYQMHPAYVKGHRLSEFSHAHYSNQSLFDLDFSPSAERWVMELQICHPSMKFGAFYEDILM